eukprot:8522370-Pyramimonas_sp.AAC.2
MESNAAHNVVRSGIRFRRIPPTKVWGRGAASAGAMAMMTREGRTLGGLPEGKCQRGDVTTNVRTREPSSEARQRGVRNQGAHQRGSIGQV